MPHIRYEKSRNRRKLKFPGRGELRVAIAQEKLEDVNVSHSAIRDPPRTMRRMLGSIRTSSVSGICGYVDAHAQSTVSYPA